MAEEKKVEDKAEEKKEEVKKEVTAEPNEEAAKPVEAEVKPAEPVAKPAEAVAPQPEQTPAAPAIAGNSTGLNGPFPAELNHWNWGAFLLSWIWSIGNSVWLGLLALISPISLIVAIILGIKGNEWAWNHKKFESVDQFKKVQKTWAIWGLILFLISVVLMIFAMVSGTMFGLRAAKDNIKTLEQTVPSSIDMNTNVSTEIPAE